MKKMLAVLACMLTLIALTGSVFANGFLEGRPDDLRHNKTGYFIWQDGRELKLLTNTRGNDHVFSGTIKTDGKFFDIDDMQTERGDHIRVSRDRDTIWFSFTTGRGFDGLNFQVRGGDAVHFDLKMDGHRINRNEIYLGHDGVHPRSSEFTVRPNYNWQGNPHGGGHR